MKKKHPTPILGTVLRKIAPRIGAVVTMEPNWQIVGQIAFKNGRKCYFKYSTLDLNPMGASEIARDKDFSSFFIKKEGYPVVTGEAFYSDDWCRAIGSKRNIDMAYRYAQKLGWPVIVKPNSSSQGVGVTLIHNRVEFYQILRQIFRRDRVALVQRPVRGRDYRIVVLDDQIISAYERIPLSVVGNGRSTILALLKKKQHDFKVSSRDTRIKLTDPRMDLKLKHLGLSFQSVPKHDERIFLLDNANLSTGGDSIDVSDQVHPDFAKIAIQLTKDMGLRLSVVLI
ncbi:MAG: cyanophycin synthetase [Candidatus Vogelbacteria bacterium CG22_combo_CG10-13_8_21_14_all_37_9]|uniref:Cyanophycin synthetase n=1 Tax=Candidatus Vogelbacteria bacterium CG22_combo_CG10-13_8_21_14_all_37_9 TaxID=1975046 RepID=A0A2H0BL97_9BACT|nr:MAG: cyanophycin synthetase [Candidatus Vogelbacteria bacterium CG22_combo_CG10-13_8_21_14_all_37_9]